MLSYEQASEHDMNELVMRMRDMQGYFPHARSWHDVYREIESLQHRCSNEAPAKDGGPTFDDVLDTVAKAGAME